MPTVSVIMPAHDAAHYLPTAVESVLRQTYRDLELVIIDDGSTDATADVARRYAETDARVRVLSQPNTGPGPARTAGFRAASGRFFAFLDSDDEWDDAFLAEQMGMLAADPSVAVVTGNAVNRGGADDGRPVRPTVDAPGPDLLEILRDEGAVFIMSVFRREVVDTIGGFDERILTSEDYDLWIRAALAGFRFARNPKPLGFYRRSANSLSASEIRMLTGILQVYRKTLPCCAEGTPARAVILRQIARFETELVAAEARSALNGGDAAAALASIDALRARRGGGALAVIGQALRRTPAIVFLAYRLHVRLRSAVQRFSAWRRAAGRPLGTGAI